MHPRVMSTRLALFSAVAKDRSSLRLGTVLTELVRWRHCDLLRRLAVYKFGYFVVCCFGCCLGVHRLVSTWRDELALVFFELLHLAHHAFDMALLGLCALCLL